MPYGQFKRFKVQNATAPQFKVLSPLSYESGRAERNALKRVFYTPEGLYTRRMSLYTSQRLLTRPKGLTRDGCRFTRANGSLHARRALHATNVALHEPTAPYPPEGHYTRRMSLYTSQRLLTHRRALHATNVALHELTAPYPPEGHYT